MIRVPLTDVQSVLCLGAHADDIEIGCGGTLLKMQRDNPDISVTWVVLASDEQRGEEASQSARSFLEKTTNKSVRINRFPDRYFPAAWSEIKEYIGELSANLSGDDSPDLIFTHRLEDRHQDHRVVAELTWNAFRDHLIFEYEIPKYEGDLGQPNVYIALDTEIAKQKAQILMDSFPSQRNRHWFEEETFFSLMRIRALESGSSHRFAEAFYCRKLVAG